MFTILSFICEEETYYYYLQDLLCCTGFGLEQCIQNLRSHVGRVVAKQARGGAGRQTANAEKRESGCAKIERCMPDHRRFLNPMPDLIGCRWRRT